MPLASEKAKEGGGGNLPPLTAPGAYKLIAAYVSDEKQIQSGDHAGSAMYSVCWEEAEGVGSVWDNILVIDPAWARLSSLWLALGQEDRNFETVEENAYAVLELLAQKPFVFAQCAMGKPSPGYPAKLEVKFFYDDPEKGELVVQNQPAPGEAITEDGAPF